MEILIIYENNDFLAVNKPAGLLVHPIEKSKIFAPSAQVSKRPKQGCAITQNEKSKVCEFTLVDWLIQRYPGTKTVGDDIQRPGLVHRLDKDTSGIMLIAKNQDYFNYLKNLFQKRDIVKTYLAVVYGKPISKKGIINKSLGIKKGAVKRTVFGGKKIQEAETLYQTLQDFGDFALLEVQPKTGRTHQIRAHLSSIGHPVVGDLIYGFKKRKEPAFVGRQLLHAYSLEFNLSSGKRIRLAAELPEDFKTAVSKLNNGKLPEVLVFY